MSNQSNMIDEPFVFGLDIGTRTIVGVVGYKEKDKDVFRVLAYKSIEHDTRAMLDGQIHDIDKVVQIVRKIKISLEEQLNCKLRNVYIAAAGRVLKTVKTMVEQDFFNDTIITKELVNSLELKAIQTSYNNIVTADSTNIQFHCAGYSIVKYFLNDFIMSNLIGHSAKKIGLELIATFLPQEVINSLYAVIEKSELKVAGLTLEPIAAINVAIPEQYRLLNIALIDIGAGTSDIAITKDGSVIAYGMIPFAGDKITEKIIHKYLVDFKTAENIKLKLCKSKMISFNDIMGIKQKYEAKEILEYLVPTIDEMADKIADKIKELNGNKSTNAVFCVGGGGQVKNFTDILAQKLELSKERVALRGAEVLKFVEFENNKIKKEPSIVTPIGISLSAYYQKNNLIDIIVNGKTIKIYDNNHLTVIDVAAEVGFNYNNLFPKRGKNLVFTLDDNEKTFRGNLGDSSKIIVNGEEVDIHYPVKNNDNVELIEATAGEDAKVLVYELPVYKKFIIEINNKQIVCPRIIKANNDYVNEFYSINEGDIIQIFNYYTLDELLTYLEISLDTNNILVNGKEVDNAFIYEGDKIEWMQKNKQVEELKNLTRKQNVKKIEKTTNNLTVIVNNKEITLKNKLQYIFVDIFDYINFDLKKPKGSLITLLNGRSASFQEGLKSGDVITIKWEG